MFLLQEILQDILQDSTLNDVPDKGCPAGRPAGCPAGRPAGQIANGTCRFVLQDRVDVLDVLHHIWGNGESIGLAIISMIICVMLHSS